MKMKPALIGILLLVSACTYKPYCHSYKAVATTASAAPTTTPVSAALVATPQLISIDMLDEQLGWGVTETQILRTYNGGAQWYDVSPKGLKQAGYGIGAFFLDDQHAWVQAPDINNFPTAGWSYRTRDGGVSWDSNPTPFSGGDMAFLDPLHGWMMADLGAGAGSNAVAVFQTINGGESWTKSYVNDPTQPGAGESLPLGGLKGVLAPVDMRTAFIGGVIYAPATVYLFRTQDAGHTWAKVALTLPTEAQTADLAVDSLQFVNAQDGFLVMHISAENSQQAIYVTEDGGESWSLTPTLISAGGQALFLSASEGIIYNRDRFFVTRNAAHSWTAIQPDTHFGDSFASMDFIDLSNGWVITDDGTGHRSLYKTTDGGATWTSIIP
jgi:photosystem II stability/assembly factor-like uncharacterized protein